MTECDEPTLVYEDNLAFIIMSTTVTMDQVRRKLSRHSDIRHHYVRELSTWIGQADSIALAGKGCETLTKSWRVTSP